MARSLVLRPAGRAYAIEIVGHTPTPLRDLYHALLVLPWPATFGVIAAGYLLANAAFACLYLVFGGIAHARGGSFVDAFFFSIQTMGTIGYGAMYPETTAANVLVVAESITGLLVTALAAGLVFAKFSRPNARVAFSRQATVAAMDGVPTLSFRIGNERGNRIVDAGFTVVLTRTVKTVEGKTMYRSVDLKLVRARALSLSRSWSVLHVVDETSPLHGATPASLAEQEAEIEVLVVGMDDATMQTVHASHVYEADRISFGKRHVDVLYETESGILLDLRKFHDLEDA